MAFFSTDEIAILSGTTVRSAIILKFDFVSGAKYVWNGETELVIDGNDGIPLYGLGRMEGCGSAGSRFRSGSRQASRVSPKRI